jgi:hypothetical protein
MAIEVTPHIPKNRTITLAPAKLDEKWQEPELKIGGVPIQHGFNWSFVPGAAPFRTTITVDNAISSQIAVLENPVTITGKWHGNIAGKDEFIDLSLQKIYIQEPRRINANQVAWELADRRREIVGHTVTIRANVTWRVNDMGSGLPDSVGDETPAVLREQFDRFALYRYIPYTKNPLTDKPWTAHELLLKVLRSEFDTVVDEGFDLGYIQENIIWEEIPSTQAITHLAALCRENVSVDKNGVVYVYPAVDIVSGAENVMPLERPPLDGGIIYRADLSRIRPGQLIIKFPRLEEVRLVNVFNDPQATVVQASENAPWPIAATDSNTGIKYSQEDIDAGKVVGCQNVIQLPLDTEINTDEGPETFMRGTWVSMESYLPAVGLTDALVRKLWFGTMLEVYHAGVDAEQGDLEQLDPLKLQEAAAIRAHYRQSWQIDPYWVVRWTTWDTNRAGIIDSVTRYRLPTPLWANYCVVPKVRLPQHARYPGIWKQKAYNVLVKDDDEEQLEGVVEESEGKQTEGAFTAGKISKVDEKIGIFSVQYPRAVDQTVSEIIPSAVDNLPEGSPDSNRMIFLGSRLKSWHTLEAVISVTPAVKSKTVKLSSEQAFERGLDENESEIEEEDPELAWLRFIINPKDAGKGPLVEFKSSIEVARYPILRGLSGEQRQLSEEALSQGLPINTGMLAAIAQVEANKIMHTFKDRLSGYAVFPGVDVGKLKLFGPCRAIKIIWSPTQGLRSEYDLTIPPTPPDLVQQGVPEALQRFVQRRLPQEE